MHPFRRAKQFPIILLGALALLAAGCGGGQAVHSDESVSSAPRSAAAGRGDAFPGGGRAGSSSGLGQSGQSGRGTLVESPSMSVSELENALIYFDFDKSDIRPDMRPILDRQGRFLLSYTDVRVRVEGHCDERGTVEYNIALGYRRAQKVKEYLVSMGVSGDRIETISYGEERPLDPGHNEAAWAKNRRAKLSVISGLPVGGRPAR